MYDLFDYPLTQKSNLNLQFSVQALNVSIPNRPEKKDGKVGQSVGSFSLWPKQTGKIEALSSKVGECYSYICGCVFLEEQFVRNLFETLILTQLYELLLGE